MRIRGTSNFVVNTESLVETTGLPSGNIESYPDNLNPCHHEKSIKYDYDDSSINIKSTSENKIITRSATRENS